MKMKKKKKIEEEEEEEKNTKMRLESASSSKDRLVPGASGFAKVRSIESCRGSTRYDSLLHLFLPFFLYVIYYTASEVARVYTRARELLLATIDFVYVRATIQWVTKKRKKKKSKSGKKKQERRGEATTLDNTSAPCVCVCRRVQY